MLQKQAIQFLSMKAYTMKILLSNERISVMGKNREKTVIEGRRPVAGSGIDEVNNVVISGFTIKNSGGGDRKMPGLRFIKGMETLFQT